MRFQHDSTATCILSVHPGPQQLRCVSRGDALDLARRFAAREHVDCWTTTDGRTFGLDLEHRPP
ncbi:MAG TPA: hypothetical protein VLT86_04760 [Vicinamibacterales bacterium]|nr:hypothetical protein [Vicinamibacterales bacterium]